MGAAIKSVDKRITRGITTRQARVRRLQERLETEQDPKVRAMIEAQLRTFAPSQFPSL